MKFEFTSVILDNVLATRIMAKPGPAYYVTYCCRCLVEEAFFVWICVSLPYYLYPWEYQALAVILATQQFQTSLLQGQSL